MEGVLLIDKPAGWTSFDVVKYVRRVVSLMEGVPSKRIKVGHSGTLDPFATGLLIILVGKKFTSSASYLLKQNKKYLVTLELGKVSSTGDPEGEITRSIDSAKVLSRMDIEGALKTFKGEIWQKPPIFSAIKVNGVRAYKLARANQDVELENRLVTIKSIELLDYEFPFVKFVAEVSSGTYIRSLVQDLGTKLKCGAYCTELRRIAIGNYSIEHAIKPEQINEQTINAMLLKDALVAKKAE